MWITLTVISLQALSVNKIALAAHLAVRKYRKPICRNWNWKCSICEIMLWNFPIRLFIFMAFCCTSLLLLISLILVPQRALSLHKRWIQQQIKLTEIIRRGRKAVWSLLSDGCRFCYCYLNALGKFLKYVHKRILNDFPSCLDGMWEACIWCNNGTLRIGKLRKLLLLSESAVCELFAFEQGWRSLLIFALHILEPREEVVDFQGAIGWRWMISVDLWRI